MDSTQNKTTFDELVSGISAEERNFLLAKINKSKEPDILILQGSREIEDAGYLDAKYKTEPFLYKFFLWLRSLITKRNVNDLYNMDLVADLARKINKNHPGLIDHRNNLILSLFYEKLKELKNCADFFKPYFTSVNENPGKFYVFLSSFIAPEISEQIAKDADPYTIPFEREATSELRTSLLKRLDGILKNIGQNSRAKLYAAVRSIEWLRQFSELPYLHFIAQFTSLISNSYTCPYLNAQPDFPAFAKVLQSASSISKEVLQAMFLYPHRNSLRSGGLDTESEKALNEFSIKSASCISMIQMFITTVPFYALGKVVFGDYDWQCDSQGGGEDWFVKYKEEWKCIFDSRWNSWLRDRKKSQLAAVLQRTFGIDSFPELPDRPWTRLWGGIPFNCEMTAGFLWWFAANKFNDAMYVLNTIVLEGIFLNKENRTELSEAVNDFVDANQQILSLADSLSENGSIGIVFEKLINEHVRTLKGQQNVDSIIMNSESSVRFCGQLFCSATRTIEKIFHGILDDEKTGDYESLQNLMTIKGRENHEFRDKMTEIRSILNISRSIFADIEPLDLPRE